MYSRTVPTPVRVRICLPLLSRVICRIACAVFGSSTILVRVPASTLRLSSRPMPRRDSGMKSVSKGTSAVPRSWKPQPAAPATSSKTTIFLNDKVHQPAGNDDDLLHVLPSDEFLHVGIGEREALDCRLVRLLGHGDRAAQL